MVKVIKFIARKLLAAKELFMALLVYFFLLIPSFTFSAPPINVSVSNVDPINLGVWDGSAVFSANDDICVFRGAGACPGACTYAVQAQGGSFTVSNGVDPAVPFRVFYNDQSGISGNQELTMGVEITGQTGIYTANCAGLNGNFEILFESANLSSLNPGIYTGTFRYWFFIDPDPKSKTARGPVDVTISISDVVQINGMNDVPLTLAGLFYQGADDFCVYRNGAGGTYSITASSGNSPGSGLFTLSSGTNTVNYNVFFADTPGATNGSTVLTEGALAGGFVGTNIYSATCTAVNASIYIETAAANFIYGGTYGDTLTLTIMPE